MEGDSPKKQPSYSSAYPEHEVHEHKGAIVHKENSGKKTLVSSLYT
jgi:hypothetical protein